MTEPHVHVFVSPLLEPTAVAVDPLNANILMVANKAMCTLTSIDTSLRDASSSLAAVHIVAGQKHRQGAYDTQLFQGPNSVVCSKTRPGIIYICDFYESCVKEFDPARPATQALKPVVGNGKKGNWYNASIRNSKKESPVGKAAISHPLWNIHHISMNQDETRMLLSSKDSHRLLEVCTATWIYQQAWNFWDGISGIQPVCAKYDEFDESLIWIATAWGILSLQCNPNGSFTTKHLCGNAETVLGFGDGYSFETMFHDINDFLVFHQDDGDILFYISDRENNRIRKFSISTGLVTTIIGNGELKVAGGIPHKALVNRPAGLALRGDDLVICNESGHSVSVFFKFSEFEDLPIGDNADTSNYNSDRFSRVTEHQRMWV